MASGPRPRGRPTQRVCVQRGRPTSSCSSWLLEPSPHPPTLPRQRPRLKKPRPWSDDSRVAGCLRWCPSGVRSTRSGSCFSAPPQKGKLETSWKPSGCPTMFHPSRKVPRSSADRQGVLAQMTEMGQIARLIRVPPAPQAGGATHSEADQGSPCPAGGGSPCPAGGECNS